MKNNGSVIFLLSLFLVNVSYEKLIAQEAPNILLIIIDDIGVDVFNGYHEVTPTLETPTLDSLRAEGITFENTFAYPVCAPTRATIMTGLYGNKTGVVTVPGQLSTTHQSIFEAIDEESAVDYTHAVIGKWHLGGNDINHPEETGVDYYNGFIGGAVQDYFSWNHVENGATIQDDSYVTSTLTDAAIEWIEDQGETPWFLWFAHGSVHTPLHVPPAHMHTFNNPQNNYRQYLAMIESVDFELNRMLNAMDPETRAITTIIIVGDNGTPGMVLQDYQNGHGKGSLYQGGVRVPLIISGTNVERKGVREAALVHVCDLFATILELTGVELPGGRFNSLSFDHLLDNTEGSTRDYNFAEAEMNDQYGYAIRNKQYKFIQRPSGQEEFYDLLMDSLEVNNLLLGSLTSDQIMVMDDLILEANQTINDWSCRDYIQNGDEEGIDCGGTHCTPCETYTVDVANEIGVKLYPNPSAENLFVESDSENIKAINIFDLQGRLILSQVDISANKTSIPIHGLAAASYMVEVEIGLNKIRKLFQVSANDDD